MSSCLECLAALICTWPKSGAADSGIKRHATNSSHASASNSSLKTTTIKIEHSKDTLPNRRDSLSTGDRAQFLKMKNVLLSILSRKDGLAAFRSHLLGTCSSEMLDFYLECNELKQQADKVMNLSDPRIQDKALRIYNRFLKPESSGIDKLSALAAAFDETYDAKRPVDLSKFILCQDAVIELMTLASLKGFLRSSEFSALKQRSSSIIPSADQQSTPRVSVSYFVSSKLDSIMQYNGCEDITPKFLDNLCRILDALPISVCLSDFQLPERPLIYVNPEFCKTTGYTANESVGRNCAFLQGAKSEPKAIEMMRAAFKLHQPIKVQITNYRKDGREFVNLLTMKPIFDQEQQPRYYIAVQFDLSNDTPQQLIHELVYQDPCIELLPNVIQ